MQKLDFPDFYLTLKNACILKESKFESVEDLNAHFSTLSRPCNILELVFNVCLRRSYFSVLDKSILTHCKQIEVKNRQSRDEKEKVDEERKLFVVRSFNEFYESMPKK